MICLKNSRSHQKFKIFESYISEIAKSEVVIRSQQNQWKDEVRTWKLYQRECSQKTWKQFGEYILSKLAEVHEVREETDKNHHEWETFDEQQAYVDASRDEDHVPQKPTNTISKSLYTAIKRNLSVACVYSSMISAI